MRLERATLAKLGRWGSGGTPLASRSDFYGGEIPWLIIEDLNDGVVGKAKRSITSLGLENSSARVVPTGTLLIAMYGSIGKLGITSIPCATNQAIAFCEVDPKKVDLWFLFYLLLSERRRFLSAGRGGTQQNISQEFLKNYEVDLPDLVEQKRVAVLVGRADRLRRMRHKAIELSNSVIPAAFHELFGESGSNAKGWPIEPLGKHLKGFEGGVSFNPVGETDPASRWRVLKVSAVSSGEFLPDESKPIAPDAEFDEKLVVRSGDLIMSRANTVDLVGAVARVRDIPPNILLSDKLWRVRFLPGGGLLPDYVLYCLRTHSVRSQIADRATGTSGSMKNVSKDEAGSLLLPIPPRPLQEQFGELVDRQVRLRCALLEALRQANHLFESLLGRVVPSAG